MQSALIAPGQPQRSAASRYYQISMSYDDPYFKLRPPSPTPDDELCQCMGDTPVKLMCALSYNPIHCIVCNLEVPPETLGFDTTLVEAIAVWRRIYEALDRLWLDSGEYEAWATSELGDITSPVNKRGRDVAAQVNARRRCYYWLFQDQSIPHFEAIGECPSCRQTFKTFDGGIFRQDICEECSIITVGE